MEVMVAEDESALSRVIPIWILLGTPCLRLRVDRRGDDGVVAFLLEVAGFFLDAGSFVGLVAVGLALFAVVALVRPDDLVAGRFFSFSTPSANDTCKLSD